jgi:hypothetical protein
VRVAPLALMWLECDAHRNLLRALCVRSGDGNHLVSRCFHRKIKV